MLLLLLFYFFVIFSTHLLQLFIHEPLINAVEVEISVDAELWLVGSMYTAYQKIFTAKMFCVFFPTVKFYLQIFYTKLSNNDMLL